MASNDTMKNGQTADASTTAGQIAATAAEMSRQVAARANAKRSARTAIAGSESHVLRAREMSNFAIGDRHADVRGWPVYSHDSQLVGAVEALFVETRTKAVRYLGVSIADPKGVAPTGTVLVPVGLASRPADKSVVNLGAVSAAKLVSAPRLANRAVTRADEDAALAALGMATSRDVGGPSLYTGANFDEQNLFR